MQIYTKVQVQNRFREPEQQLNQSKKLKLQRKSPLWALNGSRNFAKIRFYTPIMLTSLTADVQRSTATTVLQTATPRPDMILREDDWVLDRNEESEPERGLVTGLFS